MPHRLLVTIFLGLMAALCLTTAAFATPITVLPDITAWATTASDGPQAIHASPVSAAAPYQALHAWADRPVVQCDVPSNNYATIQMAVDDVACDIVNLTGAQYLEHDITVQRSLTLQGQGMLRTTLDADGMGGAFIIDNPHGPVVIKDLTMTGASQTALIYSGEPTGEPNSLLLKSVRFKNNTANGQPGALRSESYPLHIQNSQFINNKGAYGGAMLVRKTVNIEGSLFQGNTATEAGGAIDGILGTVLIKTSAFLNNTSKGVGGALWNVQGIFTIEQSVFRGNRARAGGAIATSGELTIRNSTLVKNSAPMGIGGGIALWVEIGAPGAPPVIDLQDSTLSQNSALACGGIVHTGILMTIVRSAITDNWASSSGGGLCLAEQPGGFAETEIANSTISHNRAVTGAGIYAFHGGALTANYTTIALNSASMAGGGLYVAQGSLVQLNHSILWGNGGADCAFDQSGLTSMGYNIDGDNSCLLTDPTDLPATDPLLGPLQNNGGPTETHALSVGSPALDAIPSDACLATDQRGVARPQGPGCDIGAFELEP